uniref:Uncharacterized protein n=1 Tax=viral metagenome TaxID=1070528 RepID=A0A6C0AZR3_9ZZZZ
MPITELSLESIELKLQLLNQKVDKLLELMTLQTEKKKKMKQEEIETNWSIVDYKNSVLISFSFNMEFKNYIKELGGVWMVSKKSWMFPKSNETEIVSQITEKFPKWNLIKEN